MTPSYIDVSERAGATRLGGDVWRDGRLLSVVEIQQSFRKLLTDLRAQPFDASPEPGPTAHHAGGTVASLDPDATPCAPIDRSGDIDPAWISVVAAHSGAGASLVALAVADAAAVAGHIVHLVESAHPTRSGLVATSSSELGLDPTGTWRRGLRGQVTIDRRADDAAPSRWPDALDATDPVTVVDVGLPAVGNVTRLAASRGRCILVCRATVPGVRFTEQALDALADVPVVVAVLGPGRWPGEVTASLGPRLHRLRTYGRVVAVPIDRHILVTGPTQSPLPKSIIAAGRSLLGLIDTAHPGAGSTTAPSAPRPKRTKR